MAAITRRLAWPDLNKAWRFIRHSREGFAGPLVIELGTVARVWFIGFRKQPEGSSHE